MDLKHKFRKSLESVSKVSLEVSLNRWTTTQIDDG